MGYTHKGYTDRGQSPTRAGCTQTGRAQIGRVQALYTQAAHAQTDRIQTTHTQSAHTQAGDKLCALTCLLACLMLAGSFLLASCSQPKTSEELIEQTLNETLEAITTETSESVIQDTLGSDLVSRLAQAGIDQNDLVANLFNRASCTVDSVDVGDDEKTATAQVTLSNININQALDNYRESQYEWATTSEIITLFESGGQQAIDEHALQALADALADSNLPTVTTQEELSFTCQEDGTWMLDNPDALYQALLMGASLSSVL